MAVISTPSIMPPSALPATMAAATPTAMPAATGTDSTRTQEANQLDAGGPKRHSNAHLGSPTIDVT